MTFIERIREQELDYLKKATCFVRVYTTLWSTYVLFVSVTNFIPAYL